MKLDLEYIKVISEEISWKESINLVSLPLLDNKYIDNKYVPSIFKSIEEFGMYIIIDPKIALPHSRPENGVLKNGISLLKSDHPIKFNNASEEVKLVIMFCSIDNESHIEMLTDLSQLISDENKLKKLLNCKNKLELFNIINGV